MFKLDYNYVGGQICDQCSRDRVIEWCSCGGQEPIIYNGIIASRNIVMKHSITRDLWSQDLSSVLCFEIEAARLMNSLLCLVIWGICDYADLHKNKIWQPYAVAMAVAFARVLLGFIDEQEVIKMPCE